MAVSAKRVRLHFRCRDLADMDTLSKSDPYIVLYTSAPVSTVGAPVRASSYGREVGRTEIIMNNLNPVFTRSIDVHFIFESRQDFTAVVYDYDGSQDDTKNDVCGVAPFQLSHVICSSQGKKEFQLRMPNGVAKGFIEISFTEMNAGSKDTVRLGLRGSNIVSMNWVSAASTYFLLSRLLPNGTKKVLYKSETANSSSPRWAHSAQLPLSELYSTNAEEQSLDLSLVSPGAFGETGAGSVKVSFADLKRAFAEKTCFVPKKDKDPKKGYGEIYVDHVEIHQFPTFAQSLAAGWQINMALSIDFTGSNGDPKSTHSLHYMNPRNPNQYVSAMMSVGDILMEYDTDKKIPVFGFGASFKGTTSHFFNVNMQQDPYVEGIQGALNAYGAFLPTSILSGPTNFAPTIRAVTDGARQSEKDRVYTVLLIITDGEITDMRETIDALVVADDAPLSIVIVGVGSQCDFLMMNELDGDGVNLRASNGRISRRDLVQFVPYREFAAPKPREALAAEVLREIPDQFEEYLALAMQRQHTQQRANAAML